MKKITLYEFLALTDNEQYDIIFYQAGEYLDICIQGDKRFILYAVHMFFVEVEYHNLTNKIIGKKAFVTGELLDKYSTL